jgi:hypothetical protein
MEPDKIISLFVSGIALIISISSFRKSRSTSLYQDLDRLYADLLKLGISHPQFVDKAKTADYKTVFRGDELLQYQLYAFMSWNICETIFDRKKNKNFFATWRCIIEVENELHRKWFSSDSNKQRFKPEFCKYMSEDFPFPGPSEPSNPL